MKNKVAKLLAVVMLAMAVLSMAACGQQEASGGKEAPAAEATEEAAEEAAAEEEVTEEFADPGAIPGTYTGQIDFSSLMTSEFGEQLGIEINDPLFMDVSLELKDDNTFYLKVDIDKFKADIISIVTGHADDIIAVMMDQYGYSMDQLGEVAQASGYEDEAAFKAGLIEEMEKGMNEEMDVEEYRKDLELEGTYTVNGDQILLQTDDTEDTATINADGTLTMVIPSEDIGDTELILTKQ